VWSNILVIVVGLLAIASVWRLLFVLLTLVVVTLAILVVWLAVCIVGLVVIAALWRRWVARHGEDKLL